MKYLVPVFLLLFMAACGRSPQSVCIDQLRQIESAKERYAIDRNLTNGVSVLPQGVAPFLKGGALLYCPQDGVYSYGKLGESPTCSIPDHRIPVRP